MNFGNLLLEGTGRIVNNNLYYTYDAENTTLVSKVPKPIYKIEYGNTYRQGSDCSCCVAATNVACNHSRGNAH